MFGDLINRCSQSPNTWTSLTMKLRNSFFHLLHYLILFSIAPSPLFLSENAFPIELSKDKINIFYLTIAESTEND